MGASALLVCSRLGLVQLSVHPDSPGAWLLVVISLEREEPLPLFVGHQHALPCVCGSVFLTGDFGICIYFVKAVLS